MPPRIALGYLLTGRRIPAAEAAAFGLVNEVVPADRLDRCVADWVADLLLGAPLAVRAIKEAALRSLEMPLEQAFATRFRWEQQRMHSRDAVEGPLAFAERRPPVWHGR
jgi:enoyl-CoA hydratase/carnithine racemase